MLSLKTEITWPDGVKTSASLSARTPEGDNPVEYHGNMERLEVFAVPLQEANVDYLRAWMRRAAEYTKGQYVEVISGSFDAWAV